jgi:hypothetical protein
MILQYAELEDIARVAHVSKRLRAATECTFKWRGKELINGLKPIIDAGECRNNRSCILETFATQLRALMEREYLYAKVPSDHDEYCVEHGKWSETPGQIWWVRNDPLDYSALPVDEPFTYNGVWYGVCRCSGRYPFLRGSCLADITKEPIPIRLLEALASNDGHSIYDIRRHEQIRLVSSWSLWSGFGLATSPLAKKWLGEEVLATMQKALEDMQATRPIGGIPLKMSENYNYAIWELATASIRCALYRRYADLLHEKE